MGKILNTKSLPDGKILFEVEVDYDESLQLQGHVDNIHLFSENTLDNTTTISMRGNRASTKYLLIPKNLRRGLKFDSDIMCQKIETSSKVMFIYIINNSGDQ